MFTCEKRTTVINYKWPDSIIPSPDFEVWVNGEPILVHDTNVAAFAIFAFSGKAEITVKTAAVIKGVVIRPAKWNTATVIDSSVSLLLEAPAKLSVEIDGWKPLFIFADLPEDKPPDDYDSKVLYFKAGVIHEIGELTLNSGETLYIEGGGVVRGRLRTSNAENVKVMGRGILDGGFSRGNTHPRRMVVFDNCSQVRVEGITMIDPSSWMLVFGACNDIVVRGVKQIGEVISSDGVDIVGSRNVLVEECFFRNNDDCVAVKAMDVSQSHPHDARSDWRHDVSGVLVQRCVFLNGHAGNALEIGFETRTSSIKNITFRDCDIIGAHGEGAVFSIHLGDRASVSDVLYEDIRVEHFYDKLIDFRILKSLYTRDMERGQIRNVTLRRIKTCPNIYNIISLIGGYAHDHTIEGVLIEDLSVGGKSITNADDLLLFNKYASGIIIK